MGFIQNLIEKHKKKIKKLNEQCDNFIFQIGSTLQKINQLFSDLNKYVNKSATNEWQKYNDTLTAEFNIAKLKKAVNYKLLLKKQAELNEIIHSLPTKIKKHNATVTETKIEYAYSLIGDVEGKKLDRQQMESIVTDAHNQLVIAAAGTGKTTTVVGKIKFLLKSNKYKHDEILVLSFTNASASEMRERINKETGVYIEASTFHKLGLNIITKVEGIAPKITQLKLHKFIKDELNNNIRSTQYLNSLNNYLLYNRVTPKSEFEFNSQKEYDEYIKLNPPTTINNETVKSYGELDIANFLAQNGINYIYEHPYKIDTRTKEFNQYYPDFYLPDYDIYIEYFGINKAGEVPTYFKAKKNMNATQAYQASMEWKRNTHKKYGTTLIECFAYEKFDETLIENLKTNLLSKNVTLIPKNPEELWNQISNGDETIIDGIVELFETIINLIKSNGYTIETLRQLNVNTNQRRNKILISLLEPIYNAYCAYLKEHNEIDFNDMINTATEYVCHNKYIHPYKCVIIDEYQDISKSRYSLIQSMRQSNDFDLFCVGDDWQSIYRFAGSDIGCILNFEHYWGTSVINKIETTYRFPQKLIDISSFFIMKNPFQIKKSVKGTQSNERCVLGEICGYTEKISIEFMVKKLEDLPQNSTVFFIGRYSFDVKILNDNDMLECRYNNANSLIDVIYNKRLDLKMNFITAHKSKGLQADFVFIINNKNTKMGFPSKIQDSDFLKLLLDNYEIYPYAEERRLFYVSLTRARKKAFIVTIKNQESEFAIELKERYYEDLKKERFECPICGGKLKKISGQFGEFFGCSNYQTKGCKYKRKIK